MRRTEWSAFHGRCQPIASEEALRSRIVGSIGWRGPIVEVEVRLRQSELERYRLEGRIAPAPYRTSGIIDTAAARTCINSTTVDKLLLEPLQPETLITASGPRESGIYDLALLLGPREEYPPDPISVLAYDATVMGAELLVGLDVLRHGRLTLDGPKGVYELFLPRTARSAP